MEKLFLGKAISRLREMKNMSQIDLSKASGIPQPTISNYESGKQSPSDRNLQRIATALDFSSANIRMESVKIRNEWAHGNGSIDISNYNPLPNEPLETYITDNVSVSFRVAVRDRNNPRPFRNNAVTSIVEQVLLGYLEANRDEIEELIANEVETSIGDVTKFLDELKNRR